MRKRWWAIFFVFAAFAHAHADAAFLMEEPYGTFGKYNPTGHAAVYLTGICAASPTQLRRCEAGEAGVVISRYHKIAGYDWLAIPLLPYLYAVDSVEEIPQQVEVQTVAGLRDAYRRSHLRQLAPDSPDGSAPEGEWTQLIGSAYDRKIYGFQIETTPQQDAAFIEAFNQRRNKTHFNIFWSNCADFSSNVLGFYAPHAVHRNFLADAGIMTPKQVAKSFVRYAHRHPADELSSFQIPQVPGSVRRSKPVKGVAESLLKSKKYLVPLAFLNPELTGGIAVIYFAKGRFNPKRDAGVFDIARAMQPQPSRAGTPPGVADSGPAAQTTPASDTKMLAPMY
jgi:hypothetical protein